MKTDIREYGEGYPVEIHTIVEGGGITKEMRGFGREVISSTNQGGYDGVDIDLEDVVKWLKENRPEMLK